MFRTTVPLVKASLFSFGVIALLVGCGSPSTTSVTPVTVRPSIEDSVAATPTPVFDPLNYMPADASTFIKVDGALFRQAPHVQRIVLFMKDGTTDASKQDQLQNLESIYNAVRSVSIGFGESPDDMSVVVEGDFEVTSLEKFWKFIEPKTITSTTPNGLTRFEAGGQTVQQVDGSHWLLVKTRNAGRAQSQTSPAQLAGLQITSDGISAVRGWMLPSSKKFKKMMAEIQLTEADLEKVVIWDVRVNLTTSTDAKAAKPSFDFRFEMDSEEAAVALTDRMTQLKATPPMPMAAKPTYRTEGKAAILKMEATPEEAEQIALMVALGMANEMGFR